MLEYSMELPSVNMFADLCQQSLSELLLQNLSLYTPHDEIDYSDLETSNFTPPSKLHSELGLEIIKVSPVNDETSIAAIDCSSKVLGMATRGFIAAFRGTIVWHSDGTYRYARYGPFLAYLTREDSKPTGCSMPTGFMENKPDFLLMTHQSKLEHALQIAAAKASKNGVILIDGSLGFHNNGFSLRGLLKLAQDNSNTVLGFSKKSRLTVEGFSIDKLLENALGPCFVDVTPRLVSAYPEAQVASRILVAKLNKAGYTFRVDADPDATLTETTHALSQVIGNDATAQGYPETLRIAHILSIFTSMETLALQRILHQHCGLRLERGNHLRRSLFGPYGKWDGVWSEAVS